MEPSDAVREPRCRSRRGKPRHDTSARRNFSLAPARTCMHSRAGQGGERDESDRLRANGRARGAVTRRRPQAGRASRRCRDQEPRDRRELRRHALSSGHVRGKAQASRLAGYGSGGSDRSGRRRRDESPAGHARGRLHQSGVRRVLCVSRLHGHSAPGLHELRRRRGVPDPGADRVSPAPHGRLDGAGPQRPRPLRRGRRRARRRPARQGSRRPRTSRP